MKDKSLIIILAILSMTAFYPVIYVLSTVHSKRGFDIVFTIACLIATMFYKLTLAFDNIDIFVT